MDNLLNASKILEGANNASDAIANSQQSMSVLITGIVVGLLFCFFGLKVIKIISAIAGFGVGAAVGVAINNTFDITGMTSVIVIFIIAVALGALAFFLYRFGVFLITFLCVCLVGLLVVGVFGEGETLNTAMLIALVVALIVGILAVVFVEPGTIIFTSISGGASVGSNVALMAGLDNPLITFAIAAVLAILGMIVQFSLHRKKTGKHGKAHPKKFRSDDSRESAVEEARMMLDDDDDMEDYVDEYIDEEDVEEDGKQFDDMEIIDDIDDLDEEDDNEE